jgi:hypothetical protein
MKFTDLPIQAGADMDNSWVFAVSTASETEQLSWEELQKSFTGLIARDTNGINIFGYTAGSGITVGDNGFVGIYDTDPNYSLSVGDAGGAFHPQIRISADTTSRNAYFTLADPSIYWRHRKKNADTDYYLEASENGISFTGVLNIDKNGNVGVFNGTDDLTDKFYVSGGSSKFESGNYEIIIDPSINEIRSDGASTALKINNSVTKNTIIGNSNSVYVRSDGNVGIGGSVLSNKFTVFGADNALKITNTSTNTTAVVLNNTADTAYLSLYNSILGFGNTSGVNSVNNLNYDTQNKRLGLGVTGPSNKLHVYESVSSSLAKLETITSNKTNEVIQVANYTGDGGTGPSHVLHTFGKSDGSGPYTTDVKKWSIGLYDDGSTNAYVDVFAFRLDGSTSEGAIKAYLDRDGDFDIKGSYTSNTGYCKGKFVHTYQTRLTGDCLYFNPFYPNSNTNPSGHNDLSAPFCITPYAGRVEKIQIFSSDQDMAFSTANGGRFEISVITPSNDVSANNFVSGFYVSPTSPATSLPISGIVSQFSLASMANTNQIYTYSTFSGSPAFTAGQLLQYRITDADQRVSYQPAFTVVSTISYTVT